MEGTDVLSGSLDRAAGENTGTYAIGQGTVANSNYTITYTCSQCILFNCLCYIIFSCQTKEIRIA
jgi:hypothetical protein